MEYQAERRGLQGFPAQYAVLGFLIEAPTHGYGLRARIAEGLGPLWQIASSQLYQVLHKLEAIQWVTRSPEPSDQGPDRKTYRATKEGQAAFWDWVDSPVERTRDLRVELLAKFYFLRRLRPADVPKLIRAQQTLLHQIGERMLHVESPLGDDDTVVAVWNDLRRRLIETFDRWLENNEARLSEP